MISFSDIHEFFTHVISEVETKGEAEVKSALAQLAADLRNDFKNQEPAIVQQILSGASAAQDAQTIAKDVLTLAESVLQAFLVSRGL